MDSPFPDSSDPVEQKAQEYFGIPYLYPWQRIVIENILHPAENTNRQIVLLPTGSGKSLCFLLPALLLPGPTLVIYPLLALMADQQRRMEKSHIACVVFRGEQTEEEREENFRCIQNGTRIILANPEVLQNRQLLTRLACCGIVHAAIDEAHCVSEWGDTFRPAYLTLGTILSELRIPVITAFTATASPRILARVAEVLFNGKAHIIQSAGDRPEILYYVYTAYAKKKTAFILALTEQRPMIIFCGTRRRTEELAREIRSYPGQKDMVRFYHAGLSRTEKTDTEQWFLPNKNAVLVATVAFGMGIDKADIRTVIHLDPPLTAESYAQETGRAARDRKTAKAILLWNSNDRTKSALQEYAESGVCRRQVLLAALGLPDALTAVCSGCDICSGPADTGKNEKLIIRLLQNHRKCWTLRQAAHESQSMLNRTYRQQFGMHIWEYSDTTEILNGLLCDGRIRICGRPWKGKVDISAHPPFFQRAQMKMQMRLPLFFHHQKRLPVRHPLEPQQLQVQEPDGGQS